MNGFDLYPVLILPGRKDLLHRHFAFTTRQILQSTFKRRDSRRGSLSYLNCLQTQHFSYITPIIAGSGDGAELELNSPMPYHGPRHSNKAPQTLPFFTMAQVLWTQSDIIHTDTAVRPHGTWEVAHYFPLIELWVILLDALQVRALRVGVPSGYIDASVHDDSPTLHPPLHHGRRLSPLTLFRVIALRHGSLSTD